MRVWLWGLGSLDLESKKKIEKIKKNTKSKNKENNLVKAGL